MLVGFAAIPRSRENRLAWQHAAGSPDRLLGSAPPATDKPYRMSRRWVAKKELVFALPTTAQMDAPTLRRSDAPTLRRSDAPTLRRSDAPTLRRSDAPTLRRSALA